MKSIMCQQDLNPVGSQTMCSSYCDYSYYRLSKRENSVHRFSKRNRGRRTIPLGY